MVKDNVIEKEFANARKVVDSKYQDLQKEVESMINNLLDKTYKQFEETYDANSRRDTE